MRDILLHVCDLSKVYTQTSLFRHQCAEVEVLRNVNLSIQRGRTLVIVGESGSGKSTLARCVVALEAPTSGEVLFDCVDLFRLNRRRLKPFRSRMQLVLQGSSAAVNPQFRCWEIVAEPLRVVERSSRDHEVRALQTMSQVGLSEEFANRRPDQLSGGQLQRLAIARALVLGPELLVLDEPFSGLDVSIQAQIANLLLELQEQRRLTYLFVLHDVAVAAHLADEIAVLRKGSVIEAGTAREVLSSPQHPYTQALLNRDFLRPSAGGR